MFYNLFISITTSLDYQISLTIVSFLLVNECIEKLFIYKDTLIKIKNFANLSNLE